MPRARKQQDPKPRAKQQPAQPTAIGEYPGIRVEYFDSSHRYKVNGQYVPSVTTVLGLLNKPLDAWVERITLEGVHKLLRRGYVLLDQPPATCPWLERKYHPIQCEDPTGKVEDASRCPSDPSLCRLRVDLKRKRLDAYAAKNAAADRGTDTHHVWEMWNTRREIPNVAQYPPDRHPYIRGLSQFILEYQPECIEAEMVVGSAVHGYAGRLDTVVTLRMADHGTCMVDLKTSKGVYANSHFPQLAGYEIARVECGLPPTDKQGILQIGPDGKPHLVWSDATADDFLSILAAHKSQSKWAKR